MGASLLQNQLFSLPGGSAGLPHHQGCREDLPATGVRLIGSQAVEQKLDSTLAQLMSVDFYSGQGWSQVKRGCNVIEAGHGQLVGYLDPGFVQSTQQANRHAVVGGKDRGGTGVERQ